MNRSTTAPSDVAPSPAAEAASPAAGGAPSSEDGAKRNGPWTVVTADGISANGLAPLATDARFRIEDASALDRAGLMAALAGAHALIVRSRTTVDEELLDAAPALRVIGRAGVGVDNIDLDAATARGIPVLNSPAGNTVSAAELTMALILAAARRVPAADRSVRDGEWTRGAFAGVELRGKILGLVGAGRIGGEVARRARAFGMEVVCHDPYLSSERARALGVKIAGLDEVLASADVLTLHVPLTAATEGLIGREQLAALKPTTILVNASRGGVVDEDALAEALGAGRLQAAALDVFAQEPLPAGSPLRDAPNLVLTPHLGASTTEAQELVAREIADGVRSALLEGDLSRALNAPRIGGEEFARLRPLLVLGWQLGRMGCSLSQGAIDEVTVRYRGSEDDAVAPLSQSVLQGLLTDVVGRGAVNFVNARHLAKQRGITVTRTADSKRDGYQEYLEVGVRGAWGEIRVAGAILGLGHPRIVAIDDFHLDVIPEGTLLILRNRDVPGVIGRVGTLLGTERLNIAGYHQSRRSAGGEALAAIAIDGPVDRALVKRLLDDPDIVYARRVQLS